MSHIAIIGGSGLAKLKNLEMVRKEVIRTPYGEPSAPVSFGKIKGKEVVFLPRHGGGHTIPPHEVNYRANIWALKNIKISSIIAIAAVGGITPEMTPASLVLPDQIIDYTYGRQHTYFGSDSKQVRHVDFTYPYDNELREYIVSGAASANLEVIKYGTYAAVQGPRFETAAEISRLEGDGANIVGMTGMPEAALARELGMRYATLAVVANYAAGKTDKEIELKEIEDNLEAGLTKVRTVLEKTIPLIMGD